MSFATGPNARRLTVLVGDRHELFARALARALRDRSELEVTEVYPQSGPTAVRVALDTRPDVALFDLWLDGVTAIAVAHSLAALAPEVRVVVLGWRHDRERIHQALAAGAAGFAAKILAVDELIDVIRRVGGGDRVVADPHFADAASWTQVAGTPRRPALSEAFTVRELQVLGLLGEGLPVEDIAEQLGVAPKTAQTHITHVVEKTGTRSQLQAVAAAHDRGYLADLR